MSEPWWARPRRRDLVAPIVDGAPVVLPDDAPSRTATFVRRAGAFTSEWKNATSPRDPGRVIETLFEEQLEVVRSRANRLPEKTAVELLRIAGVSPATATPASVIVQFGVSAAARHAVSIPERFQVAADADTPEGQVIFETERAIDVFPGDVAEVHVFDGDVSRDLSSENASGDRAFETFGAAAKPGSAVILGLSGDLAPERTLALVFATQPRSTTPDAVSVTGGEVPEAASPASVVWEAFDGGGWSPLAVALDETEGLVRGGLVIVRAPERWRVGRPRVIGAGPDRRFVRVRVVRPAEVASSLVRMVRANCTRAIAARTIRDEVLDPIAGTDQRRMQLRSTPVISGSLVLEVDDGREPRVYREVGTLDAEPPDAEVYTLDAATGEITFGDGVHGALVPEGYRNVVARSYQVGGGAAGFVAAGAVTSLVSSAPFVTRVTNPIPATGGQDRETTSDAIRSGPAVVRAGGRAVAVVDYEVLARRSPGARVARAFALAGRHPDFPGAVVPGAVTLIVVPEGDGEEPPIPDEETLRAVARHVSTALAPAGIEVVAAPPQYQRVRVEASVVVDRSADASETVNAIVRVIDGYLDLHEGGEDRAGWPLGGAIRHPTLTRRILEVSGIRAVPQLAVFIDGLRASGCGDHAIDEQSLVWPDGHSVVVRYAGGNS